MNFGPLHVRKISQDIILYKTRTLLVVLIIAIGVFALGVASRTWLILSRELNQSYQATNPASAILSIDRVFGDDVVKAIERMPEIQAAEGRYALSVQIQLGPDEWHLLNLESLTDYDLLKINKIRSTGGAWPPPDQSLLLERSGLALLRSEGDLSGQIGETLTIKLPNDKEREMVLSGLAHDVTEFPTTFSNIIYGYITPDTLQGLIGRQGYNTLYLTVAGNALDVAHIQAVVNQVEKKLTAQGFTITRREIPEPGQHPLNAIIGSVLFMLIVLSFFSLVLSAFLIINTVSAILARQVRQIAIMETIGATQTNIISIYIGMVLLFGLAALIVATPLAVLTAQWLTRFMAELMNFDIANFGIPAQLYALDIFAALVVPLLVALMPIRKGASITIREAISDSGSEQATQFGASRLDQALNHIRRLPASLLYTLRNIFRHKTRLAITLTTLTLASTFFMVILSVRASLLLTIEDIAAYWRQDIKLFLDKPYRHIRTERAALTVPGVVRVEGRLEESGVRRRPDGGQSLRSITIFGVDAVSPFLRPTLVNGRWLRPEDEKAIVVNTDLMSDEPDIAVGDEITLEIDDELSTWQVVGVVTSQLIGGGAILDPIAYVNYPYFARVTGKADLVNRLLVETKDHNPLFQAEVAQALEEHFRQAGLQIGLTELNADIRLALSNIFNVLISLMIILALLLAAVGGLGLMGMMSLSVLERTRELGVVHAIGGDDLIVLQIVITEGVFIGVLSWFFGVLLSLPLSRVLSAAIGQILFSVPLTYSLSVGGMLLWLGLVIILSAVASYLPAQNASHMSIREALAHE